MKASSCLQQYCYLAPGVTDVCIEPLSSRRSGEIKQLHGIGAIPIRQLRQAGASRGLSFAQ